MKHLPFPLPEGHMFGNGVHERIHRGDDPLDAMRLGAAQNRLRTAWGHRSVDGFGQYDGPTIEAVKAVQRAAGLDVTGWLDADTWKILWDGPGSVDSSTWTPRVVSPYC